MYEVINVIRDMGKGNFSQKKEKKKAKKVKK